MDEKEGFRIAIVGAGAIGSLFGGMLARHGQDVTLIGNQAHVAAIQQKGLTVEGAAGAFTVAVNAAEQLDFAPDMVFVAVKSQDVERTCQQIKPHIGDIPVIMMQNGVVSSEIAASIFGEKNIISCVLLLNVKFEAPGVVTYVHENSIVVGQAFGKNDEATIQQVQALLNMLARTEVSDNILGVQWAKLFVNAMSNTLDGMTGMPMGEYIQYRGLRRIGVLILKEAMQLVNAAGIQLESLPGIPLKEFQLMVSLPTPIAAWVLGVALRRQGSSDIVTSTLQSLRKGKPTEIDYLNGEFVKLGKQIGYPTPYNAEVVALIHEVERTGSFYTPDALAQIFENLS